MRAICEGDTARQGGRGGKGRHHHRDILQDASPGRELVEIRVGVLEGSADGPLRDHPVLSRLRGGGATTRRRETRLHPRYGAALPGPRAFRADGPSRSRTSGGSAASTLAKSGIGSMRSLSYLRPRAVEEGVGEKETRKRRGPRRSLIARGIVSRLKAMRFGSSEAKSWGLAAVPPVFPSVASTCGGEKRTSRPTAGCPAPRRRKHAPWPTPPAAGRRGRSSAPSPSPGGRGSPRRG